MKNWGRLPLVALISVAATLITLFAAGVLPKNETAGQAHRETAFERVMRTKTLRCGYMNYQPAVIKDVNSGALSGFAYELVNRIGEDLDFKVAWVEEVDPATMISGLDADRFDMICTPFWPNSARIKGADFTDGFFYSGMGVWVRSDDHRFDKDVASLNDPNVSLSVMDGTTGMEVALQNFPKAKRVSLPQGSMHTDLILNVTTGKADVVVIDNYLARDFEAKNKDSIRQTLDGLNVRTYPNAFMIKKGESGLISVIDVALSELVNSGYADQLITKYEKYPGTLFRVIKPYVQSTK